MTKPLFFFIIIIIIRFHGLSKQFNQLLLPNSLLPMNLPSLFLKISSDGASMTSCGKIPAVHNSLAEEVHSALFQ